MHELSICQSLLSQVTALAIQHQAQQVTGITVHLGPLGGVVPELLIQAFSIAAAGTVAELAKLMIVALPVKIRCQQCDFESEVEPNHLVCPACGHWRTQLLSGDEMLLASVEFMTTDSN